MSDPRLPEDGPDWPERDLDEGGAEEPAAGWSDDPYRWEPPPPTKPDDSLEGDWSDSEPFETDPPESDPFAPAPTPRQDDPWAFPPRSEPEPAYEPASSEPDFVSQPASWSDTWAEPQPARPSEEPAPEAEGPSEPEPMVADEPSAPEPEPEPAYGYTPEPDDEPEPEPIAESEPEPEPEPEPEFEPQPMAHVEPELEPDATEEVAVAAAMSVDAVDEPEPEPEPESEQAHQPQPDATQEMGVAAVAAAAAVPEPEYASVSAPTPTPDHAPEPFPDPDFETQHEPGDAVVIEAAAATTAFGGAHDGDWDPKRDGNRRRPTTAEQAVPWLIGIILALAGIVIVLLALIFSSPTGLVADGPSGSEQPSATGQPSASAVAVDPSAGASGEPSASGEQSPEATPSKAPDYGALEMTYLGRPSAVAPIYLLLRDFAVKEDAKVVAQADQGVSSYANAPDGKVSAAVIDGRAVALDKGGKSRRLADNITTVTFGWDADTVYAVRIARDGNEDLARILEIDYVSGATKTLTTIRYKHPVTGAEAPLKEAQFIDDGGLVRLYAVADGNLTLSVLGAPAIYRIDPANGDVTEVGREPILWSTDGTQRVTVHPDGNRTTLRLRDRGSNVLASTGIRGLVSHIRWAPESNEIVFTVGVTGSSGGVRQDLYVWDLQDHKDPMPLTSSGAAFGAEWRGVMCNWGP